MDTKSILGRVERVAYITERQRPDFSKFWIANFVFAAEGQKFFVSKFLNDKADTPKEGVYYIADLQFDVKSGTKTNGDGYCFQTISASNMHEMRVANTTSTQAAEPAVEAEEAPAPTDMF